MNYLFYHAAVDCGNLDAPENGNISLTGTTVDSIATYTCNEGFLSVGLLTRICQINGMWSGAATICQGIIVEKPVL